MGPHRRRRRHPGHRRSRDDEVAPFSSAGPTAIDYAAKPDIVAPGTGMVSLSAPGSHLYATRGDNLVDGSLATAGKPYLKLTGTSMAAPVVSGTIALMLQANPALTPNLVKAILQYTADVKPSVHPLRQGGGFLDAKERSNWSATSVTRRPAIVTRHASRGAARSTGATTASPAAPSARRPTRGRRTSSGAPTATKGTTSSGAPSARRELPQHRLGHQHRVGHQHRLGHDQRRGGQHRLGHVRRPS